MTQLIYNGAVQFGREVNFDGKNSVACCSAILPDGALWCRCEQRLKYCYLIASGNFFHNHTIKKRRPLSPMPVRMPLSGAEYVRAWPRKRKYSKGGGFCFPSITPMKEESDHGENRKITWPAIIGFIMVVFKGVAVTLPRWHILYRNRGNNGRTALCTPLWLDVNRGG